MYTVLVTLDVLPEHLDEFLAGIRANARASLRVEPGCLRFDVHRSLDDPHRFVLHEIYRDRAAFTDEHRAAPHYATWRAVAARCVRPGGQVNTFLTPAFPDDLPERPDRGRFPPVVLRPAELTAFSRGGGASTIPLVTRARGATVFLNGQTLFQGGAGIPLHVHNCPESVVILEGDAVVEIDGQEHALTTFDTTHVDAGVPHRFRNASDTEPMRILWTYASVDATRTLVDTGVTTRVDAEHDRTD